MVVSNLQRNKERVPLFIYGNFQDGASGEDDSYVRCEIMPGSTGKINFVSH